MACGGLFRPPPVLPPPIDSFPSSNQPPSDPATTTKWGVVKCQKEASQQFNKAVGLFLSSAVDPRTITRLIINCFGDEKLKGGMFIRGKVNFEDDKTFDSLSSSQYLSVAAESSYLEIHIINIDNKAIARLNMKAIPFAGGVEGNVATLAFSDRKGKIFLNGSVENGFFSGIFEFENFTDWQGSNQSYRGQIGKFTIPACSLFTCNSLALQQ